VRRAIESARLDVLLFADIGMDALTYFLAFWRLAPLQLTTWGHPVTSGIDTIDAYVSAAALETEGSEDQYSEALWKLPAFYNPGFARPVMPAASRTRTELGLPAAGPLYLCPQFLFKLHPEFDAALAGILRRAPQAHILLLAAKREAKARMRQRIDAALGAEASRVHFLDRMPVTHYYEVLAAVDVVLDPFHFGGCNTTCEALAMGKPIATLPARFLRGRFTLACYREMQIDDCIASSPEEFVRLAVALGRERDWREALGARIRERSEVLFERSDATAALAEAISDRLK
jgi:predicted O-linked N-acetylglucosamine transferase (SPINDLY family)